MSKFHLKMKNSIILLYFNCYLFTVDSETLNSCCRYSRIIYENPLHPHNLQMIQHHSQVLIVKNHFFHV